jgi:flagellar protein FlaG
METKAALSAVQADPAPSGQYPKYSAPEPSAGAVGVPESRSDSAEPQPGDLRLVIEQNEETGAFIYKTVDRRTGETLQILPREEVLKLKHATAYDPGAVYDGLT